MAIGWGYGDGSGEEAMTIKPGTLAIFGEFDGPYADMIAVVTVVKCGRAYGRYLCGKVKKTCDPYCATEDVTPLSDFGVTAKFDIEQGQIRTSQTGPSKATYRDGAPRNWHDHQEAVGHIKTAKQRYWARWALNKQIARQNLVAMGKKIKARVYANIAVPRSL